jgi:hypothetical protein
VALTLDPDEIAAQFFSEWVQLGLRRRFTAPGAATQDGGKLEETSMVHVEAPRSRSTYVREATPRQPVGVIKMPRFMGFVRMEEGVGTPPQALFDAMDAYIGEQAAKGVFLDGGGLYGTEDAVNFVVRQGEVSRVDGPYAEAKEVVGGWAIMQYDTLEEAVADQQEFAELHAKYWPEVTVISTLRQISTGPEAPATERV